MSKTYVKELAVGQTVGVKRFAFVNPQGGTGLSDWQFNERFSGKEAVCKITKLRHDEETGINMWAEAVAEDTSISSYMKKNAKTDDQRMFISEFDVLWIED